MYVTHDERPTIGERYTTACVSADLRLREVRSDVDYLIAAGLDRKSTRLNSSHSDRSRMPSSA